MARLLGSESFKNELETQFETGFTVNYHLAPPLPGWLRQQSANPSKIKLGSWLSPVLKFMANRRAIRNTWLDPFRFSVERKTDLALLYAFEALIEQLIETLNVGNQNDFLEKLELAGQVKGFGQIRHEKAQIVMAKWRTP